MVKVINMSSIISQNKTSTRIECLLIYVNRMNMTNRVTIIDMMTSFQFFSKAYATIDINNPATIKMLSTDLKGEPPYIVSNMIRRININIPIIINVPLAIFK